MQDLFFHIDERGTGIERELAEGITTHIYPGDQAMISVVKFAPGAKGAMHNHPEEQWGYCISGTGVRFQGEDEIEVSPGSFWRTPGHVMHTMQAGEDGMTVLDIFAPPRNEYTKPGTGFGA